MAYLILLRHGISKWNAIGLWTGWEDVELADEGVEQAREMAKHLTDIEIHKAHVSDQIRAKDTLKEIQSVLNLAHIPVQEDPALRERHYGVYQGKNKWQIKEQVGEEEFMKIRRSWDHPIPEGESLKQVAERSVPYYEQHILADLKAGKNVLVSASNNSLRSIIKHIENLTPEEISKYEMGLGELHIFEIDDQGNVVSKEIRAKNENAGKI